MKVLDNLQEHYMEAATKSQADLVKKYASEWGLTIDPEFRDLLHKQTPTEAKLFEHSMLNDGCRDPLIVWPNNGKRILVDGHHRYEFCVEHDMMFAVREMDFPNREAAKEWVIINQLARRNLPIHEHARLALQLKPIFEARAKENQRASGGAVPQKSVKPIDTQKEIAKIAGVSHDTIAKVEHIENEAPDPIKRAARAGEISVNAAYRLTKADTELQQDVANRIENGESPKKVVEEVIKRRSGNPDGYSKEKRASRELTRQVVEYTHNAPIPEYTLDMLVNEIKLDADNYFSSLNFRLATNAALISGKNADAIGKLIDDYVICGIEEIRRKVS